MFEVIAIRMHRYVFMSVAAALLVTGCMRNPVRTDARHAMGLKGDVASVTETVYVAENEDGVVSKGRLADGGWYVTENGGECLSVAVVEREITYYGKHV